jgi:AcrR family transcriptional regulator
MPFVSSTESLPEPPWSSAKPRGGPAKAPLSRDAILDAAMAVLDAEGLDAVSMRAVADRLGTGPASLYAHVSGKDELTALMLDRVIGEVTVPAADPERWSEQLREGLRAMRDALAAHRDIARVAIGEIPTGHNAIVTMEGVLAILLAGGLPKQVAAYAADLLPLYVVATAYEDSIRQTRMGMATEEDVDAYISGIRDYFASLPIDRFPVLVSMVPYLTEMEGDRFEFGLDVLIGGLAALSAGSSRRGGGTEKQH